MRFQPGVSGNPGGRPKVTAQVIESAREHSPAAISTLVEIMNDHSAPHAARIAAANALLDRGYGKPPQTVHPYGIESEPERNTDEIRESIRRKLDPCSFN